MSRTFPTSTRPLAARPAPLGRTLTLALALVASAACEPAAEDPLAEDEHCGEITADQTWAAGPHLVSCDVFVSEGAHLTIEAGAEVYVAPDASLQAGCAGTPGSLSVAGTAEEPVWITSTTDTTESWNYLRYCDDAVDGRSALRHLTLEHAGAYDNLTTKAGLILEGAEVRLDSVVVQDVVGHGVHLKDGARLEDGSSGLVVSGVTGDAVRVDAAGAGSVPADLVATDNGEDLVRITGGTVSVDDTWAALAVPWYIEDAVGIAGSETVPAVLSIEPGATLYFKGSETLTVAADDRPGALLAVGTAEAPITFSAAGSPDPGAWGGIVMGPQTVDAETVLEHVEIAWARTGLKLYGAGPTVDQALIRGSSSCGLYLLDGAEPVLGEVTFEDNAEDICE